MLDNFEPAALKVAAAEIKAAYPAVLIEARYGMYSFRSRERERDECVSEKDALDER